MKQVSLVFLSFLTALSAQAQQDVSVISTASGTNKSLQQSVGSITNTGAAVTLTVNGNRDLQLSVNGRDYNISSGSTNGDKTTIALINLETGQHTLLVIRTDQYTNRQDRISVPFNLRYGYDMLIKVNGNSSLELIETKKIGVSHNNQLPMSDAAFNNLFRSVRNQQSTSTKRSLIAAAFSNTNNFFTSLQVEQLLRLINAENFRLQLAKLSYRSITDPDNFGQLYDLFNSQASKDELTAYVNNYDNSNNQAAMSDVNFNNLYQGIKNQWPVSTQMNSLIGAFNNTNNYFNANQASQLIQIVSVESDRLSLAKLSYRSITDRNNFSQIYNLLNYQSSKDELTAYVNNYGGGNNNGAMSDANFNSLYQTIQQQWPLSTQMNSLTNAFNNTNNYFSVYQASQLIQLVSIESNRLQLAKLSYRSITDRNNFTQIYNLLNTQASRDELSAFVNNNTNNPKVAMSDANFDNLYQTIQQQLAVSIQMNSLTNAFNNIYNYFSTYQVSQLIQIVSSESNRLQLVKLSYRSITDLNNFSQIYNLLNYQSSKDELTAYIKNNGGGNNGNIAMSDANFNALVQSIKFKFFPGEKMATLTETFNNTSNYFTTNQAKQLIQLISLESNRLQLGKSSYRTITDRNNFSQLYDILSSQASRDELDVYVKAYRD